MQENGEGKAQGGELAMFTGPGRVKRAICQLLAAGG